nr:CASP-like protein 4A1 [Lolium perenne]
MPPTRGATSKDADIAGTNRSGCSAFARSSPKTKSLKPIHEGEEDTPASQHTNATARSQPSGRASRPPTQSCPTARTARAEQPKREPPLRPSRAAAEPTPHVNSLLAAGRRTAPRPPEERRRRAASMRHGTPLPWAAGYGSLPHTVAHHRSRVADETGGGHHTTTMPRHPRDPSTSMQPMHRGTTPPPTIQTPSLPGTAVPASPPPPCEHHPGAAAPASSM